MFRNPHVMAMLTLYELRGKIFDISGFKINRQKSGDDKAITIRWPSHFHIVWPHSSILYQSKPIN